MDASVPASKCPKCRSINPKGATVTLKASTSGSSSAAQGGPYVVVCWHCSTKYQFGGEPETGGGGGGGWVCAACGSAFESGMSYRPGACPTCGSSSGLAGNVR